MRDGFKHEMANKEKFIVAGRRNRMDAVRLNIKLESYDKDKVKRCFSISEQMKRLLADIERTRRTTGHSKEAQQPTDRGDTTYQKSLHYNTPNRLTEKRLCRWRECERNLQHFLKQHQSDDSRRARCPPTNHYQAKLVVGSTAPTGYQCSPIKQRPHTAVVPHSKKEEHPTRPTTSFATQSRNDLMKSALQAFKEQDVKRRSPILRFFDSCEMDTISDIITASVSDTDDDEQLNKHWQPKNKENGPHFESVQRNNYVGERKNIYTTKSSTSDYIVDLEHRVHSSAPKHSSNVVLKTTTNTKNFLPAKVRRVLSSQSQSRFKHGQTAFRQSIIVSKFRRKRMLDELVDHSSPNEKEIIQFERLQLCKLEQHILTKATKAFCAHIEGFTKCDKSSLSNTVTSSL